MNYFLTLAGILFAYMNVWFFVSLIKRRNDVADVAWGLGFVLLAWISFFLGNGRTVAGALACVLVTIWGIRLAAHIYFRNRGKTEDYRYMEWRKAWGKWFYIRSYFQVYILQGLFLYCIALPLFILNRNEAGVGLLFVAGIVIWTVGFFFEVVGDRQLAQFIHDPANKGKLMTSGLWAYSRHPNYFGEVTQWWGIWLMALSAPGGWIGIIGPFTISFLILKVSGVPLLEKKMALNPEFESYKKRVSMFFPLPPRRERA